MGRCRGEKLARAGFSPLGVRNRAARRQTTRRIAFPRWASTLVRLFVIRGSLDLAKACARPYRLEPLHSSLVPVSAYLKKHGNGPRRRQRCRDIGCGRSRVTVPLHPAPIEEVPTVVGADVVERRRARCISDSRQKVCCERRGGSPDSAPDTASRTRAANCLENRCSRLTRCASWYSQSSRCSCNHTLKQNQNNRGRCRRDARCCQHRKEGEGPGSSTWIRQSAHLRRCSSIQRRRCGKPVRQGTGRPTVSRKRSRQSATGTR